MEYDEDKFAELVLYVAQRLDDDPDGGAVKLNKALWWSECAHLRQYGRPISGAEFQKLEHGPAPRRLPPVRARLLQRGDALLEERWYLGYRQDRLVPKRPPRDDALTVGEREIVDQVVEALRGKNASEVSAESHEEIGWRMVDFHDTIPLSSALLARDVVVTPAMTEHATRLAERLGRSS
jgi:hypothetical protein